MVVIAQSAQISLNFFSAQNSSPSSPLSSSEERSLPRETRDATHYRPSHSWDVYAPSVGTIGTADPVGYHGCGLEEGGTRRLDKNFAPPWHHTAYVRYTSDLFWVIIRFGRLLSGGRTSAQHMKSIHWVCTFTAKPRHTTVLITVRKTFLLTYHPLNCPEIAL